MIDNSYNRIKMRGYVKALRYVIGFISDDDDAGTLREDLEDRLKRVEKEWNIRPHTNKKDQGADLTQPPKEGRDE